MGFTFSNEGFRMYIPIGISSPVGEQAAAHIPDKAQLPDGRFHSSPTRPAQPFVGPEGRPWAPLPIGSHGQSLSLSLSLSPPFPLSVEPAFF